MTTSTATLLRQAATEAAGGQLYPAGALYVVATPIGNLADLTLRAIHVLGLVDAVTCEDTRHSAGLLRQLGLEGRPLLALHAHNERVASEAVVARLARGERIACITDAGTPGVSDPGATLVATVRAAGHRVVPIPGASSAVAALSVAGDETPGGFRFVGFLPARGSERDRALTRIAGDRGTTVLFEAPHRIASLATALAERCGARRVTLGRELTKQFETVETLEARDLPAWLAADANRARGEFVLVLHGVADAPEAADADGDMEHDAMLRTLLAAMPLKQAVAVAVELSGAARNVLYARALALQRPKQDEESEP